MLSLTPPVELSRQVVEGSTLCAARIAVGDERVAEWAFSQDYDPGFVKRHSHQIAGLWCAYTGVDKSA